jgi:hypothetical protein
MLAVCEEWSWLGCVKEVCGDARPQCVQKSEVPEQHAGAEGSVVVGGGEDALGLAWGVRSDGEQCLGVVADEQVSDGVVVLEALSHVDVLLP